MCADVSVVKGGEVRVFVQESVGPNAPYVYYGCLSLDGPEQDEGEPTPIYCPSSTERNKWDIVDEAQTVQALGSTDFTQRMDRFLRDAWWSIRRKKCKFNMQAVIGQCHAPDNFSEWDSKILFDSCRLTSFSLPALNTLSGDDNNALDLSGSISFRDIIPILRMKFSERGAAVVVAEVLDGLFSDSMSCGGNCGEASDGCQKGFFLTLSNAGSPGLSSQLIYTDDGGQTMSGMDIPTLGGLSGNRIEAVGQYIVVISQATGSHHSSLASDILDGSVDWAEVDGGYIAGKGPRAIWSKSASETFVAAAGGYIYFMSDPNLEVGVLQDGSATTQDLNDISGSGMTVVAVGDSNAVLVSDNDGDSFELQVGPEVGIALNAVHVISSNIWFIGTANGHLYYTIDGGDSYTQVSLPSGITIINDIRFTPDGAVGFMAVQAGASARVYRATDGGRNWYNREPHLSGLPTAERINFVYPCNHNVVAAGGRKTSGGDGVIAIAE